jgi:hypothetical protein
MSRQLLINGLSAVVVIALVWWIASNSYWEEYDRNTGLQGEALTNPFYAAQRLSELLGAHTKLRHEIMRAPPPQAALVIGDWNWDLMPERRERLERWVQDGGRLVVLRNMLSETQFNAWTGVTQSRKGDRKKPCPRASQCPPPDHSYVQDPGNPGKRWNICDVSDWTFLATSRPIVWRLNDTDGHTQTLRLRIGRGSVTIINADPFTKESLPCGDDALLFVAATQLHAGDPVEFLTEDSGPSLLQLVWTYGAPVVLLLIVLIVLWLWRSGVRFGPLMATPDPARRSLAEQIRGTGRFTLRFGAGRALHAASVRALNETAARRVPHFERLAGEARIEALASLAGVSASELSAALERAARNPHELRKAIATLELARRHLGVDRSSIMKVTEGSEHAD